MPRGAWEVLGEPCWIRLGTAGTCEWIRRSGSAWAAPPPRGNRGHLDGCHWMLQEDVKANLWSMMSFAGRKRKVQLVRSETQPNRSCNNEQLPGQSFCLHPVKTDSNWDVRCETYLHWTRSKNLDASHASSSDAWVPSPVPRSAASKRRRLPKLGNSNQPTSILLNGRVQHDGLDLVSHQRSGRSSRHVWRCGS